MCLGRRKGGMRWTGRRVNGVMVGDWCWNECCYDGLVISLYGGDHNRELQCTTRNHALKVSMTTYTEHFSPKSRVFRSSHFPESSLISGVLDLVQISPFA